MASPLTGRKDSVAGSGCGIAGDPMFGLVIQVDAEQPSGQVREKPPVVGRWIIAEESVLPARQNGCQHRLAEYIQSRKFSPLIVWWA